MCENDEEIHSGMESDSHYCSNEEYDEHSEGQCDEKNEESLNEDEMQAINFKDSFDQENNDENEIEKPEQTEEADEDIFMAQSDCCENSENNGQEFLETEFECENVQKSEENEADFENETAEEDLEDNSTDENVEQEKPSEEVLQEEDDSSEAQAEEENNFSDFQIEKEDYLNVARRLQADFDNFRKHSVEDVKKAKIDGQASVIEIFLPCLDTFKEAKKNITDENVLKGIEMIENKINDALKELGVEKLPSIGQVYNPHLHNVIACMRDEEKEDGIILEEFQAGYKFNDKVLRYAKVIVNKKED